MVLMRAANSTAGITTLSGRAATGKTLMPYPSSASHGTLSCKNSSNSNSHTDSPSDFTISANSCSGHTGRKVAPPSSTQKRHSPSSSANTYTFPPRRCFSVRAGSVCRRRVEDVVYGLLRVAHGFPLNGFTRQCSARSGRCFR